MNLGELFDETALASARAALARPLAQAEGLAGRFYGEDFYQVEQARLFPGSWCAVTVAAAIPNAGDMLPIDLAGWPVVVVRTRTGEIKAFHNICRHRGIRLVSQPTNAAHIACPWHRWTYALDGGLIATPELGGARVNEVEGFDKQELGLKSIRVGQWLDLVFVNLDGHAPPFDEYIAPVRTLFADCDFDNLRHGHNVVDDYPGNWKIATEGGIEDYHLTFGHPQLEAHLYRNTTPCVSMGSYTGGAVEVGGDDDATSDLAWGGRLPALKTRSGGKLPRLFVLSCFPTATILITADHVMLGTILPDGPLKTRIDLHLYFDGEAATDPNLAKAREETVAMWHEVIHQDVPFVEAVQAAARCRDAAGIATRFSPYWEAAVHGFQRMVVDGVA